MNTPRVLCISIVVSILAVVWRVLFVVIHGIQVEEHLEILYIYQCS